MFEHELPEGTAIGALTERELEVLGMVAGGLRNIQIADDLGVTVHAVKFHLASVYRKLHVGNRTEAAAVYVRATTLGSRAKAVL